MNYYSNIYWHFTGSPKDIDWTTINSPNEILNQGIPKCDNEAFTILKLILKSKMLKAISQEKIDWKFKTQSFCCVTDIPIQNLKEHSKYYGRVAIGFNHAKVHSDFNPVFYIPRDKLKTKLDTLTMSGEVNSGLLGSYKFKQDGSHEVVRSPFFNAFLASQVDENELGSYIYQYFKITNFSDKTEGTFYREREWRKLNDFNFDYDDVAAVIVPAQFFKEISEVLSDLGIKNVTILNWEFLDKV